MIPSFTLIRIRQAAMQLAVPALLYALPSAHGASLFLPALIAAVNVDINLGAPPPPRHEVIVERDRPSRDHVWVPGYWMERHHKHEWVAGHWERPPHGRTVWVEPRWEKREHGYVFIEGRWADSHHDEHGERDHDRDHH